MTLSVAQTSYSAVEGTELSVCISYSGGELSGVNAMYGVFTEDGSATVDGGGESCMHMYTHLYIQTLKSFIYSDYDALSMQCNVSNVADMDLSCIRMITVELNDDTIPETQQNFKISINSSDTFVNIRDQSAIIYINDNGNDSE